MDCHDKPNQNIRNIKPKYKINSFIKRSAGKNLLKKFDEPNNKFVQDLKKKCRPY